MYSGRPHIFALYSEEKKGFEKSIHFTNIVRQASESYVSRICLGRALYSEEE